MLYSIMTASLFLTILNSNNRIQLTSSFRTLSTISKTYNFGSSSSNSRSSSSSSTFKQYDNVQHRSKPSFPSTYDNSKLFSTAEEKQKEESASSIPNREWIRIKDVEKSFLEDEHKAIEIKGWVRTVRKQKTLAFVEVNDGSDLKGIQCVLLFDTISADTKANISKLTTGTSVTIIGKITKSQGKQAYEITSTGLEIIGDCPGDTYPLAKKRHTLEYLRTIAHLRSRTNTHAAISRVRSTLSQCIHEFFSKEGFLFVQTPIITASDCEGAGEMFQVTTLDMNNPPKTKSDPEDSSSQEKIDYTKDFFTKPAYLTVSGQLNAETYASALGNVYTFGPTFRAENSQTTRHLAEFTMLEPELAFCNLSMVMDNVEQMLKYVVKQVVHKNNDDLEFFSKFYTKDLLERLDTFITKPYPRVPYIDAIKYLQEEISKDRSKWQFPDVEFGTDLATEHERWLAEEKFKSCVFVYDYPKSIKSFYMRDNEVNDKYDNKETVAAVDLLVPGVGELVGGSQREERLDYLLKKMEENDLNPDDYWWYLDLRRFGSVPHSGYGLGFERLVTYVCGIENIRDAIAFPRFPGNAEF